MYEFRVATHYQNTVKNIAQHYDSSVTVVEENADGVVLRFAERPPQEWDGWLTSAMALHRLVTEYRVVFLPA